MTSTLTRQGQITLPQEVRRHLGVSEGDRLEIIVAEDGSVRLLPLKGSVRRLSGLLRQEGASPLSVEEIDGVVAEAVAEDDARIRAENA